MIKNERQYKITKAQAEKFSEALTRLERTNSSDAGIAKLEKNALLSQYRDLKTEIEEYEALVSGRQTLFEVNGFEELPDALVKARIAQGISQKQLSERIGLKEQQIQRYEATNYSTASIARINEVVRALGVKLKKELRIPETPPSMKSLIDRIIEAGLDKDLLLERILPPDLSNRIASKSPTDSDVCQVASVVSKIFGRSTEELLSNNAIRFSTSASGIARFKIPAGAEERKASAYTIYAHYLSLLLIQATPSLKPKSIIDDADEFRSEVTKKFGEFTLSHVLEYAWDCGVVVLPLSDRGAFHGAFWRIGGRNVVVLKQTTSSLSRWLIDCLHEIFHAAQEPELQERSIIEASETSIDRRNSDEEQQATAFASDAVLDGRAEELAQMCVDAAGGRIPRLKSAVQMVAANEGVDVGALANYMAFRLSLQNEDWWGTATNLQSKNESPHRIARDWLISKLDLTCLCETDRDLLTRALEF